jgi:uncharacterized DUF497 family protein
MSIWVAEFEFNDDNLDELWEHGITDEDVLSVHERSDTLFLRNKKKASGTHKMVGRDASGRLLTIVLKPISRRQGIWRPITGYPSNPHERRKWSEQ